MSSCNPSSTPKKQRKNPRSLFQTPQQISQPQSNNPFFSQPPQPPSSQPQQIRKKQQQQSHQLYLFTNDGAPASYSTKLTDLHPYSQKLLLEIEEKVLEYRRESQRLDQRSRLYDSSISTESFEFDASRIVQELGVINATMDRQKAVLRELMLVVKDMLRSSEVAADSFMMLMLQPRFRLSKPGGGAVGVVGGGSQPPQPQGVNSAPASSGQQQAVQASYFYRGVPKKPTAFLLQTVVRFEKYLGECRQRIEELQQFLALDSAKYKRRVSVLESLPKVMSNVHDFLVPVATKVENMHQSIESMRRAYLAEQRRRGEYNDPFLEADRREKAKQEAAAKRVHPTLHLPAPQTSTQVAGFSYAPQTCAALQTPNPSSGGGGLFHNTPSSSLFATPQSAAPTSSFLGPTATTLSFTPDSATPSHSPGHTPGSGANVSTKTKPSRFTITNFTRR